MSLCILVRSGQVLLGAEFAVDTFFTIGGFIACYMLTQHLVKKMRPPAGEESSNTWTFHARSTYRLPQLNGCLLRWFGFWQVVRARHWVWLGCLFCTSSAGCASLRPTSLSCASTGKS